MGECLRRADFTETATKKKKSAVTADIPIEAANMGFSRSGKAPSRQAKFTLDSGPVGEPRDESQLAAFDLFWTKEFTTHVLQTAVGIKGRNPTIELDATEHNLKKYLVYLIASGMARYSRERSSWRRESLDGLFRNDFLTSLFTYDQLVEAKKIFQGERDAMTKIFNKISSQRWVPFQ